MFSLQQLFSSEPLARARIRVNGRIFDGSYHVFGQNKKHGGYGLKGWMKVRDGMLPSAFLEFELEGPDSKIKNYILDLRKGNRDSHVTKVTVELMPLWEISNTAISTALL